MSAMQLRLNELTERFAGRLPDRITAMSRLLMHVDGETVEPAPAAELERLLHSLAGTAGTFGFTSVASLASQGEALCAGAGGGLEGENLRKVRSLIRQLAAVVSTRQR